MGEIENGNGRVVVCNHPTLLTRAYPEKYSMTDFNFFVILLKTKKSDLT